MSNLSFTDLIKYAKFKEILTEYHKIITKEFGIQPLKIHKSLIGMSKVFKFSTHHEMINKLESQESILTIRKEVITITTTENDGKYGTNDIKTKVVFSWEDADALQKSLFENELMTNDTPRETIHEFFEGDMDEDEIEITENLTDEEYSEWLLNNRSGAELISSLGHITHNTMEISVCSEYANINITASDF